MAIDLQDTLAPLTAIPTAMAEDIKIKTDREVTRRIMPTDSIVGAYMDALEKARKEMSAFLQTEFVGTTVSFIDDNLSTLSDREADELPLGHYSCSTGLVVAVKVGSHDHPLEWSLVVERTDGESCRVFSSQVLTFLST